MSALYRMEQDASAESCKRVLDIVLFSLLAVILIFSLTLIYRLFRQLQRTSSTGMEILSQFKRTLIGRHSPLDSSYQEGAEIALVGVWMSDDINPKLIHRVALSAIDTKMLERFADNDGYLYVFSDPELNGEQKIRPPSTAPPAYHGL